MTRFHFTNTMELQNTLPYDFHFFSKCDFSPLPQIVIFVRAFRRTLPSSFVCARDNALIFSQSLCFLLFQFFNFHLNIFPVIALDFCLISMPMNFKKTLKMFCSIFGRGIIALDQKLDQGQKTLNTESSTPSEPVSWAVLFYSDLYHL